MTKHITRHRGIGPVIAGTGVNTATIRTFWDAGYDIPHIASQYPHLSSAQIMAALAYERTRRRRLERWIARRLHGLSRCGLRLGMWLGDWSERWA